MEESDLCDVLFHYYLRFVVEWQPDTSFHGLSFMYDWFRSHCITDGASSEFNLILENITLYTLVSRFPMILI